MKSKSLDFVSYSNVMSGESVESYIMEESDKGVG